MSERPDAATWRAWGIDPEWSRVLDVPTATGASYRWHVLDTGATHDHAPESTIVCVHGNPTWAYAWKSFLRTLGERHRVIAIDQLGMGYSERTDLRRYATRIADLGDVIEALEIDDELPFFLAAHDWGGAVAMGWAVDHAERVDGMVLCNTGIAVPDGRSAPGIIRLAASAPLRDLVCRRTSGFVEGTVRLSGRRISTIDRQAFRAPYRHVSDRAAIADFVGDIPLTSPHPSEANLADVAARLRAIEAPVLLAWGAADPVFDDDFATDLAGRLPNTSLQRFASANHLVMAEADVAATVDVWLGDVLHGVPSESSPGPESEAFSPLWSAMRARSDDDTVALLDAASGDSVTFSQLVDRIESTAAELVRRGLAPGDRVAMLTPPGVDLIVAVYAVWRAGGVTVIADRGLGLGGLGQAIRSARPGWVIGPRSARAVARTLRWARRSRSIDIDDLSVAAGGGGVAPGEPDADDLAAVLFTSGATGPAKGVRYTHRQLAAQRDALGALYEISSDDRLVAAFAPFALYGPALGITSVLPDCDVTAPGELSAQALEAACGAVDATMVFASPAALANVVDTAGGVRVEALGRVRVVLSAGAPVPSEMLRAVAALAPSAELHTPYGMTEALPVADHDLTAIESAEASSTNGVCVGPAVPGAEVRIVALDFDPLSGVPDEVATGLTGEVLVRAPWVSEGYAGRWETQRRARPGDGWHRTGDVGHVDDAGRLWIEGRSVHVIHTVDGPITSVSVERSVEQAALPGVRSGRVAAVGVGPRGVQQLVVVIESEEITPGLAPDELAASIRASVSSPVAAVLVMESMPVDIRHNAKIDRIAVGGWASGVLAGSRPARRRPWQR